MDNNMNHMQPYEVPPMQNAPGKTMLKVVSIVFIVVCALFILGTLINILLLNWTLPYFGGEAMRGAWIIYYGVNLVFGTFGIIMGIMGVRFCNDRSKAGFLQGLGAVYLTIMVIDLILVFALGAVTYLGFMAVGGVAFDLIMGVLFIIAATFNKQNH